MTAFLVTVVRRGRFQLHPMLAAFDHPRDQQQALKALPADMCLDDGDFEEEYERRLDAHKRAKARKTETHGKVAELGIRRPQLKPVR